MFFYFIFCLHCLIVLSIRSCQASIRIETKREIKEISDILGDDHSDGVHTIKEKVKPWFPITSLKIKNKVGEDNNYKYRNENLFKKLFKYPTKHRFTIKYKVCRTKRCIETGLIVQSNLNESVDPCDDFYEFACGGWINNNPIPSTSSQFSQFDLVENQLSEQLKGILEAEFDEADPLPVRAAQMAYKACIDTDAIESLGVEPLLSTLNQFGGWPLITPDWNSDEFDLSSIMVQTMKRWSIRHLFHIYVTVDRANSSQNIITVDQGAPILPRSMMVDPSAYPKQIEAYADWITRSAYILALNGNFKIENTSLTDEVHEMVKFEMKLARLTSPSEMRRDSTRMHHSMTLRHLTDWTNSATSKNGFKFNWLQIMKDLFNGTGIRISNTDQVNVKELDFMFHLTALIEETPIRVLANYFGWRIVKVLSFEMTESLRQLMYEFEHVYSGSTESQPRWQDCVDTINDLLGFAVGYKYVKGYFNEDHKKVVEELTNNMKIILKSRLSSLSWMDTKTRAAALEKLESMNEFIGYPDWYNNVTYFNNYFDGISVSENHLWNYEFLQTYSYMKNLKRLIEPSDRNAWPVSPAVVNAYNNIHMNSIIFPAGILQSPFFSLSRPESLNYGSIGIIIGHEIMHGFDDMGRQNDKYGNLIQWWSDETLETYKKKAQCFIDQYGRYRLPELDETFDKEALANGINTQGENIADNGGLEMGYLAFKKYMLEHPDELRLPGVEKYSSEQLFFIGYASNWCESVSKESLLDDVVSGVHSPNRLRTIGAVSNSVQFSHAFNCKLGSPMNPIDKCSIW